MTFRVTNWVMAALFGFAALLQYNDPDPLRWMVLYVAAMIITVCVAMRGDVMAAAPLVVGGVALCWGVAWSTDVPDLASYARMFDSWEMKNVAVEEARETGGLLIVGGWMLVLVAHGWRQRRARDRVIGTGGRRAHSATDAGNHDQNRNDRPGS